MTTTTTDTRATLADRLATLARECAVPLRDLAEWAGIDRATLHKWRSPRYVPSKAVATLVVLADTLDVSTDWLLGRTNDRGGGGLPCRECARRESELAELRAELAAVRTERHELRARLVAALAGRSEPPRPKAARFEPVDDHEAVAARVAALKAAKVAKYASSGREGLAPAEMDEVLQEATS